MREKVRMSEKEIERENGIEIERMSENERDRDKARMKEIETETMRDRVIEKESEREGDRE